MLWTKKEDNWRVPVKCWASNLEEGAMQQGINMASMPCVFHHVAMMPDAHQGMGVCIGGVLALKNAICPNAIGVDIACLDGDTEILTPKGWKPISEYRNEKILQFDPQSDIGFFKFPKAYIKKPCDKFYKLKNSKGLDQVVSHDHNLLVYKKHTKGKPLEWKRMYPEELYGMKSVRDNKGYFCFKTCFDIVANEGVQLSDELIRVDIMVQADGRIVETYADYRGCELHFRKERKIKRARLLLEQANIKYNEYKGKDGTTFFSFHIPLAIRKNLEDYYLANRHQLEIVCDECLFWDGHRGYRSNYCSTDKANVDVIQFAFTATNRRASIYCHKSNHSNKLIYNVIPTRNQLVGYGGALETIKSRDGYQYCFTTDTGFFLCRRNGYTFITGNCGMAALKTNVPSEALAEMSIRREWQTKSKEVIPVGEGNHDSQAQEWLGFEEYEATSNDKTSNRWPILIDRQNLHTLGGGNHFVELQKDTEGNVWIMIHSGSRNLGHRIATYYHNIAKDLCKKFFVNLPDEDLAFLPVDTAEGRNYLRDMNFAMSYAKENRKGMMDAAFLSLKEVCDSLGIPCEETWRYDIHHNYAALEYHFGENVWVHRKGATSAKKGETGIIPGSMGTASYIVEGLGNPESFMSCSHGAGRKMSRSAASQNLTKEECDKAMEGIVCDRWNKVNRGKCKGQLDLSEAPGAYKDIEEVISNESDLVKPIVRLTPLAVLKG